MNGYTAHEAKDFTIDTHLEFTRYVDDAIKQFENSVLAGRVLEHKDYAS
jgi:hypothetical protein